MICKNNIYIKYSVIVENICAKYVTRSLFPGAGIGIGDIRMLPACHYGGWRFQTPYNQSWRNGAMFKSIFVAQELLHWAKHDSCQPLII